MHKTRMLQYSSSDKLFFILQKIAALKRSQKNIPCFLILFFFFFTFYFGECKILSKTDTLHFFIITQHNLQQIYPQILRPNTGSKFYILLWKVARCCLAFKGLDGSVVLSVISQFDLLWEDNINWEVLPIVRLQKKVLFLAQEMTIFGISKPHFTFWEKNNPSCTQDNKTRKQAQHNKTYHLASTQ